MIFFFSALEKIKRDKWQLSKTPISNLPFHFEDAKFSKAFKNVGKTPLSYFLFLLGKDTLGFLADAATKDGLAKDLIRVDSKKKMGIIDGNEILSLIMIRLSMCL